MNELTVHVAWWLSRSRTMVPRLVLTTARYLSPLKAGLAGGTPTLRAAVPFGVYVQWLAGSAASVGVGVGVGVGVAVGGGLGVAVGLGVVVAEVAVLPPPEKAT